MASIRPIPSSVPKSQRQSIPPAALYGTPGGEVRLRIATGGAGQSGLLQKLAEEFIDA